MNPTFAVLAATLVAFSYAGLINIGYEQRVTVRGKLVCPSDPSQAVGVKVKLVDKDMGIDIDDGMAKNVTDRNGEFWLNGTATEIFSIDPRLKIYHNCNNGPLRCARKWKFTVPSMYIFKTDEKGKTFELGTWNLEAQISGEETDCIH